MAELDPAPPGVKGVIPSPGQWEIIRQELKDLRVHAEPPLRVEHLPGGQYLNVVVPPSAVLSYTKLTANWSSNTADVVFGNSCADIVGSSPTTNAANIVIKSGTASGVEYSPLVANQVVAFIPFASPASNTLGSGTNLVHGMAMPTINEIQTFPVNVLKDGGSDGTGTSSASYTYTCTSILYSGVTYGTAVPVKWNRPFGSFTQGSNGLGCFFPPTGTNGTGFKLLMVDEVENTGCG